MSAEKRGEAEVPAGPVRAPLHKADGSSAGDIELPAPFAERARDHLVYEVVQSQLAARRGGNAATKTRAFVSGGGKKPWRQKGTGRARSGSSRSPVWAGGATVFGPQPRSYEYRLPARARRVALRSVLADRSRSGSLHVVEDFGIAEPKTKRVVEFLGRLGLEGSVLIVSDGENRSLELAARNLPHAKVLRCEGLNVFDVLRYKHLVMSRAAVAAVAERLAS